MFIKYLRVIFYCEFGSYIFIIPTSISDSNVNVRSMFIKTVLCLTFSVISFYQCLEFWEFFRHVFIRVTKNLLHTLYVKSQKCNAESKSHPSFQRIY